MRANTHTQQQQQLLVELRTTTNESVGEVCSVEVCRVRDCFRHRSMPEMRNAVRRCGLGIPKKTHQRIGFAEVQSVVARACNRYFSRDSIFSPMTRHQRIFCVQQKMRHASCIMHLNGDQQTTTVNPPILYFDFEKGNRLNLQERLR